MPNSHSIGQLEKKVNRELNKKAKVMYGKPYDKLTEEEKRKVRNAGTSSRNYTPITIEEIKPLPQQNEEKIYHPDLVNFCQAIYKPVATLRFVFHLVGGLITLLNLYSIFKGFSSAGISALFTVRTLYVLGFILIVVLFHFLQELLFKIGWSDK